MKECYPSLILLTALSLFCTMQGCGLDDRGDRDGKPPIVIPMGDPTPPDPTPTVAPPIPPVVPEVKGPRFTLEWMISPSAYKVIMNRSILQNESWLHSFRLNAPITLSQFPEDSVQIRVNDLPVKLIASPSKLKATIKAGPKYESMVTSPPGLSLTPSLVSYQQTVKGVSDIQFSISGLSHFFKKGSDDEERLYVTLQLTTGLDEEDKVTLDFVLMTPPSKVTFTQKSVNAFEATTSIPEEIKYLESKTHKLSLIQVVELQDLSDQSIAVDLSSKVEGKLKQKRVWTDPQYDEYSKSRCFDTPKTIETTDVYSTEFVLLPLTDDLPEIWTRLIENEQNAVEMIPGGKGLFGVYATPTAAYAKDFKSLLQNRSPKEFARKNPVQTVTVDVACNFDCASFNSGNGFKTQCGSIPVENSSRKSCEDRVSTCQTCFNSPVGKYARDVACNECFGAELTYHSDIEELKGEFACPGGWQRKSIRTKQAKKGIELGPILLEIQDTDTYADVRYNNTPKASDPSSRDVSILLQSTVQDQ